LDAGELLTLHHHPFGLADEVTGGQCIPKLHYVGYSDHRDRGVLGQHFADENRLLREGAGLVAVKVKRPKVFGSKK
jgi:hypothetical protein